jgi:acyl-CoA synthetase (AMP-forming)/AMP-acid ligase II
MARECRYYLDICLAVANMSLLLSLGWQFPWAITAVAGTHVMLRKIDYGLIWHHLKHDRVTHYNGAPTLQTEIVNHPDAVRLERPVIVMTGGGLIRGVSHFGITGFNELLFLLLY